MRPLATFTASGEDVSLGDLNIFRTLARHPALFQSWAPFGGWLLTNGTLAFHERELLILRTAVNYQVPVRVGPARAHRAERRDEPRCRGPRGRWPRRGGVDRTRGRPASCGGRATRLGEGVHGHVAGAGRELDERQLIELCVLVGQYHLVAFMLNSVGVQPEPGLEPLPAS